MRFGKETIGSFAGLTIMEMVIALTIITIIFAAILPQFRLINNSWDSKQGIAEVLQNGRVLVDHVSRNLSTAAKITLVSDSTEDDGYIEFEDNDGNSLRYDIRDGNYVEFGPVGSLSDLAGPVRFLRFYCYDTCDLDTPMDPVTDYNSIRFVKAQAEFVNAASMGQDKTFTASVYLRTGRGAPCTSDIVGWWKFDETSGTTATDSSGNGNDGTLVNMNPGTDWITGQVGGALDFDGNNDYVTCGSDSSLDITDDITIAFWLYLDSFNGEPDIITKGAYNVSYSIWITSSGQVRFALNNDRLTSSSTLSTGTWYHIAVTREGSDRKIYINGQENASDTYGSAIGTTAGALTISSGSYPLNGRGDDVRIYDHALGPEEVARLANILAYREFNEAKVISGTSITITTPDTNEGDLLIAAVATDGDTSLAAPGGEGWTQINVSDYSGEVTLGAWWKLADASESASHQFTWGTDEQAYGWMMRFTGHDPTDPIDNYSSYGESSSTPTSPAVTTTAENCLILRLGAFDDDDIVVDAPGLSGHSAITMDKSASGGTILFQDGFETGFANWTTNWALSGWRVHSGSWSAQADRWDNDLTSTVIDTSGYGSFTIEFWYWVDGIDWNDDVYLQLYDSSGNYDDYFEVGDQPEGQWRPYQETITDAQYLHSNFSINFAGSSIDPGEYLYIDDVVITVPGGGTVSGGAGCVKQWNAGDSGTSNFSLTSSNEAQMLTISIAPDTSSDGCVDSLRP